MAENNSDQRDKLLGTGETRQGGIADKNAVREYWLDVVKPVERAGRLDHIPARKAETLQEKSVAKTQNHWISRKSFGFPDGSWHERIYGTGNRLRESDRTVTDGK